MNMCQQCHWYREFLPNCQLTILNRSWSIYPTTQLLHWAKPLSYFEEDDSSSFLVILIITSDVKETHIPGEKIKTSPAASWFDIRGHVYKTSKELGHSLNVFLNTCPKHNHVDQYGWPACKPVHN